MKSSEGVPQAAIKRLRRTIARQSAEDRLVSKEGQRGPAGPLQKKNHPSCAAQSTQLRVDQQNLKKTEFDIEKTAFWVCPLAFRGDDGSSRAFHRSGHTPPRFSESRETGGSRSVTSRQHAAQGDPSMNRTSVSDAEESTQRPPMRPASRKKEAKDSGLPFLRTFLSKSDRGPSVPAKKTRLGRAANFRAKIQAEHFRKCSIAKDRRFELSRGPATKVSDRITTRLGRDFSGQI